MIVGSIKEDLSFEKRVSITPETAKNIINLGLKVIIENNYATHIGILDKEYETVGVEIKKSSKEVFNNCNLLAKVNCPSDDEISNLKDKTILIGMLNPSKNQNKINNILKKILIYFLLNYYPVYHELNPWMFCLPNQIWQAIDRLLTQFTSLKKLFQ